MKKTSLFVLASGMLLASCSSAFKTGQTPDDVYYSYGATLPAREDNRDEKNADESYSSYWSENEDAYLRMKVRDRDRWSSIDDVNYWYGYNNPRNLYNTNWFAFNSMNSWNNWGWGIGFNSWSNPWAFNSYYNSWNNPWCWNRPVVIVDKYPSSIKSGRPGINYSGYTNSLFDRGGSNGRYSGKTYQGSSSGNDLFRSIFRSSGSSGSSTGDVISRPGRLFDGGSSGIGSGSSSGGSSRSSGGGGSSSSGGGGSRGGRGGN